MVSERGPVWRVRTLHADVLDYDGDRRYDLICTHSLVTLVAGRRSAASVRTLAGHLAPEGRICFSNRVWTEHLSLAPEEMEQRVNKTSNSAIEKLAQRGIPLPCERDRFLDLLRRYGYRRDNHPPLPMDHLERWIEEAGLAIEIAVPVDDVVHETRDRTAGPFPIDRGPRMWFQLRQA